MDNSRSLYGRYGSRSYDECPCPVSPETLTNAFAEFADKCGLDFFSLALRTRGVSITLKNYDEWNGGIWTWLITVSLTSVDYATFGGIEEKGTVLDELGELANTILDSDAHNFVVRFSVSVINVSTSNGVTNQGRAHSSHPAPIEEEGLRFRYWPEVLLFKALRDTGLPIMPLPVVISNRPCFNRIEPDFFVICQGMMFVVEVDGERWHQETPAKAQERLSHLEDEGVRIIRVLAENCKSIDSAKKTAKEILSRIKKMLESR